MLPTWYHFSKYFILTYTISILSQCYGICSSFFVAIKARNVTQARENHKWIFCKFRNNFFPKYELIFSHCFSTMFIQNHTTLKRYDQQWEGRHSTATEDRWPTTVTACHWTCLSVVFQSPHSQTYETTAIHNRQSLINKCLWSCSHRDPGIMALKWHNMDIAASLCTVLQPGIHYQQPSIRESSLFCI